jgi:hypothetical protein
MLETEGAVDPPSAQHQSAGPELHLTITSIGGSVEHYHHFLLGFFVPLVNQRARTWQSPKFARVLIRSCGPMDALVRELRAERIVILDKNEHQRLGENRPKIARLLKGVPLGLGARRYLALTGHDLPPHYSRKAFAAARSALSSHFKSEIENARLPWETGAKGPRILLIERGKPNAFYLSDKAEIKRAGTMRRSIPNHRALHEALAREFGNVANVMLEGMRLTDQLALFGAADVIIAQHGAALSNLIWAKPEATIIEIAPDTLDRETLELGFFSNLSRAMGLGYHAVRQPGDHAEVDPDQLCGALRGVLAKGAGSRRRA